MPKTFHVITRTEGDYEYRETEVLYAFDNLEEANYTFHNLQEEHNRGVYYELHTVDDDHPFPKLTEEEMRRTHLAKKAHERAKCEMERQRIYAEKLEKLKMKIQKAKDAEQARLDKIEQKKRDREEECQMYKNQIDEFLEWLEEARLFISTYEPNESHQKELCLTPNRFEIEATYRLESLKEVIQQYLLDNPDERVMDLLIKSVPELLNIESTNDSQTTLYVPKRLRDLMERL